MAKKQERDIPRRITALARYTLAALLGVALLAAGVGGYRKVDGLLRTDSRFHLPPGAEPGEESPNLRLEGAVYTPRDKVFQVFAKDYGRSIYLMPLAERRRMLIHQVDWVRDASVLRFWPNLVTVRLVERKPVAFAKLTLPGEEHPSRVMLIDEEGVLLPRAEGTRFGLPVLAGLKLQQGREERALRIRRMLRMQRELGAHFESISEVDVADADNLKLVRPIEGRAIILMLGDRRFLTRLENFLNHYDEVRRHTPSVTVFDLRVDDRIIGVAAEQPAGGEHAR